MIYFIKTMVCKIKIIMFSRCVLVISNLTFVSLKSGCVRNVKENNFIFIFTKPQRERDR